MTWCFVIHPHLLSLLLPIPRVAHIWLDWGFPDTSVSTLVWGLGCHGSGLLGFDSESHADMADVLPLSHTPEPTLQIISGSPSCGSALHWKVALNTFVKIECVRTLVRILEFFSLTKEMFVLNLFNACVWKLGKRKKESLPLSKRNSKVKARWPGPSVWHGTQALTEVYGAQVSGVSA